MVKKPYNSDESKIMEKDMEALTEKQAQILDFIVRCLSENNPPSQREVAAYFGMAQNSVYQLVSYLKHKGYLVDSPGHRGLRLSDAYQAHLSESEGIPIVGRVAAGQPILAQENIEGYLDIQGVLGRAGKRAFLLRVTGDSMVDDGIMDGDLVLVKPGSQIANGRIGVVLLDDEATIKRVYKQKSRVVLKSANKQAGYKPMYFTPASKKIRILGRVVGCIRMEMN